MTFTGEIHPFADQFPRFGVDEQAALTADIAANGLLHPLILDTEGRLLDGRNRLASCEDAGVEPNFVVHEGDPYALIVTANTHRRNLEPGQIAAARAIALAEQGKRVQDKNGEWRWAYGNRRAGDVSVSSMHKAGVVWDDDPGRLHRVLLGAESLEDAYNGKANPELGTEAGVMVKRRRRAEDNRRLGILRDEAPKYARLITRGTMTLDAAWAAYEADTRDERERAERRAAAAAESAAALVQALALLRLITQDTAPTYIGHVNQHATKAMLKTLGRAGFTPDLIDSAITGLDHLKKGMTDE